MWTAAELRKASQEDRLVLGGDFGKLEVRYELLKLIVELQCLF